MAAHRKVTEDEKGGFGDLGRNAETSIAEEPGAGWASTPWETARRDLCGGAWVIGRPTAMALRRGKEQDL